MIVRKILSTATIGLLVCSLVACAPTSREEIRKASEAVTVPTPTTPNDPEELQAAYIVEQLRAAKSSLLKPMDSATDLLSRKGAFPKLSYLALPGRTSLETFFSDIYSTTGWQFVFTAPPKSILKQREVTVETDAESTAAEEDAEASTLWDEVEAEDESDVLGIRPEKLVTLDKSYRNASLAEIAVDVSRLTGTEVSVDFPRKTFVFSSFLTRTFEFPILPGEDKIKLEASRAQNDADSPSKAKTSSESISSVFTELVEEIEQFIVDGKMTSNTYESSVTVSAPREEMRAIERRVEAIRARLEQQIVVEFVIAEVFWNDNNSKQLYLKTLFKEGLDFMDITIGTPEIAADSNGNINFKQLTNPSQAINGILKAANDYGKTDRIIRSTIVLQNGYPAALNVGTRTKYISGADVAVEDGVSVTTYEHDEYGEGLTLHMIGKVVNDDSILVSLNPTLSTKVGSTSLSVTDKLTADQPIIQDRTSLTRFMIANNSVMMFGGMQESVISDSNEDAFFIPSSRKTRNLRRDIIMMMSTRIANSRGEYTQNFK